MFGRLTTVRLKTAEDALSGGRIDEAFEIVSAPDLSDHRRAQQLLSKLVAPFLSRGQENLMNRRFAEAIADFDRAERCGFEREKVAEWQDRAVKAMAEAAQSDRKNAAALAEARNRMAAGSLAGAESVLANVSPSDPNRERIAAQIDSRSDRAAKTLEAARLALKRDQLGRAIELFRKAEGMHSRMEGMADMEAKLVDRVVKLAVEGFRGGRLNRAEQDLSLLGEVGRKRPERVEIEGAIQLARSAAEAIAESRYARSNVLLGRLEKLGPKAGWVSDARKCLDALEDNRRALLEGPLGMLSGDEVPSIVGAAPSGEPETLAATVPVGAPPVIEADPGERGLLPNRMMLRVDGVGSFLLVVRERMSIGRAGPGGDADLQLVSDLSERQAEIVRAGDDYFVMAASGVELAGRAVEHALLQDGDRIRLGRRVRLKFRRPSLKSNTAVLELGEGVRTTTDCRRVILWGGPLLIGGRRECHIPIRNAVSGAILVHRGGTMSIKTMGPGGKSSPVTLGMPFEVADVRMSIQAWPGSSGPGRVMG